MSEKNREGPVPRRAGGYTFPQAAAVLGVPYKTLRRAAQAGEVRTIRFANTERVPNDEVQRLQALFDSGLAPT